jgi:hypothetical protein
MATGVLSTPSQKSALQTAPQAIGTLNAGPPNLIGWIINFKIYILYFPLPLC